MICTIIQYINIVYILYSNSYKNTDKVVEWVEKMILTENNYYE